METDNSVFTVGEFTELLSSELSVHGVTVPYKETLYSPSLPLQKRFAAAIVHDVLLRFLGEEDEENWDAALSLRDLYDCHTCVIHIAQTFVKGIIPPSSDEVFGTRDLLTKSEAKTIVSRIWNISARKLPAPPLKTEVKTLSFKDAASVLSETKYKTVVYICDDGKCDLPLLKDALKIPFSRINQNPYIVTDDFRQPIFLFSPDGYFSVIAARILSEYGYEDMTVIKLIGS